MLLFLDTSDLHNITFALVPRDGGPIFLHSQEIAYNEHDKTLSLVDAFLKKHKTSLDDLTKIIACAGPGSFTGTRVGLTIAQALGFAKKIPVVAIPKDSIPSDLHKLYTLKAGKKLTAQYNRSPF
jgi:tRNA threonylcarbamoyl adenosine modification protein YeaZ